MQQNGVYDLLKMLEISLEEGFPIIPRKYTIVKTREIETLIEKVSSYNPEEVENVKKALEGTNVDTIKEATEKLTKVFYELSEKLYSAQAANAQAGFVGICG